MLFRSYYNSQLRSRGEHDRKETEAKAPLRPSGNQPREAEDFWSDELEEVIDREPLAMPVGLGRLALNYGALTLVIASLFVKYLNLFVSVGMLLVVLRALWRLNR